MLPYIIALLLVYSWVVAEYKILNRKDCLVSIAYIGGISHNEDIMRLGPMRMFILVISVSHSIIIHFNLIPEVETGYQYFGIFST